MPLSNHLGQHSHPVNWWPGLDFSIKRVMEYILQSLILPVHVVWSSSDDCFQIV